MVDMNPILDYKEKHKLTWYQLGTKTDISIPQIMRIAKKSEAELLRTQLKTVKRIKENLGINLI